MPELEHETGLAKLEPLTRSRIAELIKKASGVADHFGNMPHKDALAATAQLEDLVAMIEENLPGHESADNCEGCGAAFGADDDYRTDSEGIALCPRCGGAHAKPDLRVIPNQENDHA